MNSLTKLPKLSLMMRFKNLHKKSARTKFNKRRNSSILSRNQKLLNKKKKMLLNKKRFQMRLKLPRLKFKTNSN